MEMLHEAVSSETLDGNAPLVVTLKGLANAEQKQAAKLFFERELPGRKIIVIDEGVSISTLADAATLNRLESKIDALLTSLIEDIDDDLEDEDEDVVRSLDGDVVGYARAPGTPL